MRVNDEVNFKCAMSWKAMEGSPCYGSSSTIGQSARLLFISVSMKTNDFTIRFFSSKFQEAFNAA